MAGTPHDIPDAVMDQAFLWAVKLNSGLSNDQESAEFDRWLQQDPQHQDAWSCVQILEDEFTRLRHCGSTSRNVLEQTRRSHRTRRLGVTSTLAVCFIALIFGMQHDGSLWSDYATGAGEQQALILPSGSQIWMNSRTQMDLNRESGRPRITLFSGEILVDSSKASAELKPMIATDFGTFTPIGTRFTVTAADKQSTLKVIKGQVRAESRTTLEAQNVSKGQAWALSELGGKGVASNGLSPGAWVDGVIEANNANLTDVLDILAEQHKGWITYSSDIDDMKVTGLFRLDDTNSALTALSLSLPVKVERHTDYWITVSRK